MCGVAGVFAYAATAPALDRGELRLVSDHMATRGPDGAGEWYDATGRVGLAHRRLAIIDLTERAAQPMASSNGDLVISFNGEIYNHRELRRELEKSGHVFRTDSDTEVLLHLYTAHGTGMLTRLRGMFAFALWDARRRAMLLARDALGIKPLYYSTHGGTLRVASQVKALLQADVDTSPDPAGHAGFLLWGSVPEPWTLYRGIKSLPAGHYMWTDDRGASSPVAHSSLCDVLADAQSNPARGTPEEALEQVADAIRDSVAAHLVADVPVGIFLSAGLDSAMLASIVRAQGITPTTLTLGFAEYARTTSDEAPEAELLARHLGTHHHTVYVRKEEFLSQREQLLAAMDQPSIDGVNTWFVAQAAARHGFKVALSGLGGDELFASYPSFRDIPRITRAAAPTARLPGVGLAIRRLSEPLLRSFTSPKYAGLLEYGGSIGGAYLLRRGLHMPWELPHVMDPDMAREGWRTLNCVARLDQDISKIDSGRSQRLAITALEMSWYMRHQLLADADWAGMAHSVEIRVPFVDLELVRKCAPIFAANPQLSKKQVVRAAAPDVPDSILNRAKTGFSVPVREWLGGPASASSRGMRGWAEYVRQSANSASNNAVIGTGTARASGGSKVLMLMSDAYGGHGGIAFYNRCLSEAMVAMEEVSEVVVVPRVMRFSSPQVPAGVRFLAAAAGSKARYLTAVTSLLAERFALVICGHIHLLPLAVVVARLRGCPVVLQIHGIEAWRQPGRWIAHWISRVDEVWTVSQVTAARMNIWAKLPASIYRVMPNTFHASQFGVAPRREDLITRYRLSGKQVVMTLARLAGFERYKGIDEILEVFPALLKARPSLVYMVVGDGDDQKRLQQKAATLGVSDHVIFTGFVTESEKADYLRLADVFALPGRGEGFGIVFLEALACGVPVVGSLLDGSREALLEGALGELADPDSSESLIGCFERALAKPKGIPDRLAEFGWTSFEARVAANVRPLLSRNKRGHRDASACAAMDRELQ